MQDQASYSEGIENLVDIQDIHINTSLTVMEKKKSYYQQIKDPHRFRFGDIAVRVSFLDDGPTLPDRIRQYLLSGQGAELTST